MLPGPLHSAAPLAYRLLQPAPQHPQACVLLLHGVGSNENDLAGLARDFPADTLVVLARGPLVFGPGQYAWFRVAFTAQGPLVDLDQAEASRQQLIALVEHVGQAYGVLPANTLIAGFSQGGLLSTSIALSAPEKVGGFAMLSGRILPELAPLIAGRKRLQALRGFIGHGEFDDRLPFFWAERATRQLDELGIAHEMHRYPIGHTISRAMADDFTAWVSRSLAGDMQATST